MVSDTVITDEMRAKVGMTHEPVVFEIEKGAIRRFAQAVEDPNPLWIDDEYARQTGYGGIVCPPGFFGLPAMQSAEMGDMIDLVDPPLKNILFAGTDCDFYLPIRPGDILISYMKLTDLYEKSGSSGTRIFMVFEANFKNQRDDVVARIRYSLVFH